MGAGLRAVWASLSQAGSHITISLIASVVASILSLPLLLILGPLAAITHSLGVLPFGMAVFIGFMPCPSMAGLQYVARDDALGDIVRFEDQWVGLRRYGRRMLPIWAVSSLVTVVIFLNVTFYGRMGADTHSGIWLLLEAFWFGILIVWLSLHLYVYPLALTDHGWTMVGLYRRALVCVAYRPLFQIVVFFCWISLTVLLAGLGLAAIGGFAVSAGIQQNALVRLMRLARPVDEGRLPPLAP